MYIYIYRGVVYKVLPREVYMTFFKVCRKRDRFRTVLISQLENEYCCQIKGRRKYAKYEVI